MVVTGDVFQLHSQHPINLEASSLFLQARVWPPSCIQSFGPLQWLLARYATQLAIFHPSFLFFLCHFLTIESQAVAVAAKR